VSIVRDWRSIAGDAASSLGWVATAVGATFGLYKTIGRPIIDRYQRVRAWFVSVGQMAREQPARDKAMTEAIGQACGELAKDLRDLQRQVRSSVGILRARIEAADDFMLITDPMGEITAVTAGFTKLTGLDTTSSRRERWKLAIAPDDRAGLAAEWHDSLRTGNTFAREVGVMHVAKGGLRPCLIIASPVLVEDVIDGWAWAITPLGESIEHEIDPDAARFFAEKLDNRD
jgi:PAS domain-containing protein